MMTHRLVMVIVIALGLFLVGEAQAQSLSKTGPCPGTMTFTVTGAQPFGRLAFIHAANTGSWMIPSGMVCGTTVTGLAAPVSFAGWITANASGNKVFTFNVPPALCGRYLQFVDTVNCTTSNVIQL